MSAGIIVALDDPDPHRSMALAEKLGPSVSALKVGLILLNRYGPRAIEDVSRHARVFCDAKLHDIPNTVAGAAGALTNLGVWMFTAHASGGSAMMRAAVEAASQSETPPLVAAVTVLTSISEGDLEAVGQGSDFQSQVLRLADLALSAGAPALVCSPHEIRLLREEFGDTPVLVVPGIRDSAAGDDQARTMSAAEASAAGANYLVVGRPVIGAPDPSSALGRMLEAVGS